MKHNQKDALSHTTLFVGRALFAVLAMTFTNAPVHAQTISDYSALPESFLISPDQTPNILIVFDTSTSMLEDTNGDYVGGHRADSRSFKVRHALRSLLSNNVDEYNVGLMVFGGEGPLGELSVESSDCNDYIGCGAPGPISFASRRLTGTGYLVENLEPLTNAKKNRINALLETEPIVPTIAIDARGNPYDFGRTYFKDEQARLIQLGVITSGGGTPLRGSLETAERYLVDGAVNRGESLFFNTPDGADTTAYPILTEGVITQCRPNTYVFLVTDGAATIDPDGNGVANRPNEAALVSDAAAVLYGHGIETFVFGFAVTNTEKEYMNTIARGGSGGLRDALISDSTASLQNDIAAALTEVTAAAGSASGISITSSSSDTAGSVVHALYNPILQDFQRDSSGTIINGASKVKVSWTSTLSAFFLDDFGYLREDSQSAGVQGQLDDYTIDKAFKLNLENVDSDGDSILDGEELRATRLNITGIGTAFFNEDPQSEKIPVDELDAIWEAADLLGKHYDANAGEAIRTATGVIYGERNRPYSQLASAANGYRRIYSWLQTDPSSEVFDDGQQLEFIFDDLPTATTISKTINSSNFSLLDVPTADDARQVIEYIRGNDYVTKLDPNASGGEALTPVNFRNRTINGKSYLLGDIVHSTAVQVDTPDGLFNSQFGDDSYTGFREAYDFRRRVIYVGGNDGLLHAFNGGFWDGAKAKLNLSPNDGSAGIEHELGAELWAYAPMNLLPHLKWLKNPSYNTAVHVAYMDGPVQAFDVRAFDEDSVHINGWGTILVAGMRLGGGDYPDVDVDSNPATNNSFTSRSAYVIVDVTDPSKEPQIIGEITHPDLGFTTSVPTVMKEGDDWYLVFGSGPNDISTATSVGVSAQDGTVLDDREAKLFRYKLNQGDRGFDAQSPINIPTSGEVNSFVGDMVAKDWNSDYNDDAVYFGVVKGTELDPSGGLYRYVAADSRTGAADVELLVDVNQPVIEQPLLKTSSGKNWVLFGTGRYLISKDVEDTNQNSFYGVIEPREAYSSVTLSSLLDVSEVKVKADVYDDDGNVTKSGGDLSSAVDGQTTFNQLKTHILSDPSVNGWTYRLPLGPPAAKNTAPPISFRNTVFYTYFEPPVEDGNQCKGEFGTSFINAVDIVTGTASYVSEFGGIFGTDSDDNLNTTKVFGKGAATGINVFVIEDPQGGKNNLLRIRGGTDAGTIADIGGAIAPRPNGRSSWRELKVQ
jgi:type IV pilus assembly protein PilY1